MNNRKEMKKVMIILNHNLINIINQVTYKILIKNINPKKINQEYQWEEEGDSVEEGGCKKLSIFKKKNQQQQLHKRMHVRLLPLHSLNKMFKNQ